MFGIKRKQKPVSDQHPCQPDTLEEKYKDVLMSIKVVNNATDKEYVFKSENYFGLQHDYIEKRNGNYDVFVLNQNLNSDATKWQAVARLTNFSAVEYEFETVKIILENGIPIHVSQPFT